MANFIKKGRNSIRWVVVKFTEGKDYSVIPTNWLIETDTDNLSSCSVKYCKWPQKRVTSDDLKLAEDPDDSWAVYKIKVLDGNKTYGQFAKAWHKQVLESTDDEQISNKKRKQYHATSSSDDSYVEDNGYNIAPAVANQEQEKSYINLQPSYSLTSTNADENNLNINTVKETSNILTSSFSDLQVPYIKDHNQHFSNSQIFIPASDNDYSPLQHLNFDQQQNLSSSKTDGDLSHLSKPSTSEGSSCRRVKNIGSISIHQFQRRIRTEIALLSTVPVKLPSNEQNNKEHFNEQINLESLNNQPEEPVFPITAHTISNHLNINDASNNVQPILNEESLVVTNDFGVSNQDIVKRFRKWVVDFNVSHRCANEMLSILCSTGLKVPKDVRTILAEHKANHSIVEIENGSYLDLVEYMDGDQVQIENQTSMSNTDNVNVEYDKKAVSDVAPPTVLESQVTQVEYMDGDQVQIENQTISSDTDNDDYYTSESEDGTTDDDNILKYECKKCKIMFRFKSWFNRHLSTHDPSSFRCSYCPKVYKRKDTLGEHMSRHVGGRVYKCITCDKDFSDRSNLRAHQKSIHNSDPVKCPKCQNMYADIRQLRYHDLRMHTNKKPFHCECKASFAVPSMLAKHRTKMNHPRPK